MKGKIEIILPDDHSIAIKGNIDNMDDADAVIIFDRLADAMELSEDDRLLIGVVIAGGGIEALGGPVGQKVRIAAQLMEAVEAIKNKRQSNPLD